MLRHGQRSLDVRSGSFVTDPAGIVGWLMSALPRKHRCRGRAKRIVFGRTLVIQAPKRGLRIMRHELADYDWSVINRIKQCRRVATRYDSSLRTILPLSGFRQSGCGCALMSPRPRSLGLARSAGKAVIPAEPGASLIELEGWKRNVVKNSPCADGQITSTYLAGPRSLTRGASRSSRVLGAGCDGRLGCDKTKRIAADGEVVAFWYPDAGIKLVMMLCIVTGDGGKKAGLQEDHEGNR
jgi:hypothetical protein